MQNIPEGEVIPLKSAVVRIDSAALNYELQNSAEIAAYWSRVTAANPALFNGPFFMAEEAIMTDQNFRARYHRTRFATMMHWKANDLTDKPWHIFGVGVIVSSDGKLIAGRMAPSTSAAGRIYFPAGSFDEDDVSGDHIDIDGNMLREVEEETGISLARATDRDERIYLVTVNRSIALFRRHYFDTSADDILARIRSHIAAEEDPELDDIIAISAAGEMGAVTPPTFRAFADWHFG
ncbi:MAG: NUDIX hydrolase [Phyllobacterium sp.]|uniref:NUDIX hydrolase n=1 Tax=Phyllobacterium sp. TaxID=1871046 RepID=UPI0030F15B4E